MECKISVVVPVYNVENYLGSCLDSVLNQDFESFEIVVVNDGSTDGSLEIAKTYEARYPEKVRLISQENKGLGGARNTGIDNAKGEYIVFVDSDDTIKHDMLSSLYNEMTSSNADIAIFGIEYVDENGKAFSRTEDFDEERLVFTLPERPLMLAVSPSACNKMFKLSLFRDNNIYFPERAWYEDLRTTPKLMLEADKMVFVKKYFYNYLQRQGSIMHNSNVDKNKDMLDTVEDVLAYYKKREAFTRYFDELEFLAAFHIMTLCTYRVATSDVKHPLLKQFYDYTEKEFPHFKNNKYLKEYLSIKNKTLFALSVRRSYRLINLLNIANSAAKKIKAKL